MADLELRLKHGKGEVDNWTKIEDKARRKTIQNRLAQRKRRTKLLRGRPGQRNTQPVSSTDGGPLCHDDRPESSPATHPQTRSEPAIQAADALEENLPFTSSYTSTSILSSSTSPTAIIIQRSASPPTLDAHSSAIGNFLAAPGLAEHRFIVLSQYAFLRAFVHNAQSLQLAPNLFADDNAVSPYTILNPYPGTSMGTLTHFDSLMPTTVQLSTFHHPYIDVLASPKLRDNILSAGLDDDTEDELCHSLHDGGFTVWGSQPWSPMGWEVSPEFLEKWAWLVDEDTVRWSNFWRFERGEVPLKMVGIGRVGEVVGEVL